LGTWVHGDLFPVKYFRNRLLPEIFFVPFADVIERMKLVKAEVEEAPGT